MKRLKAILALLVSLMIAPLASEKVLQLSKHPRNQGAETTRSLADGSTSEFSQRFRVKRADRYKKLEFMKIVASILKTARKRKLQVQNVTLGSHLKKVFENPNLTKTLSEYINDPKFFQKYKAEKRKYRDYLKARKQRLVKAAAEKNQMNDADIKRHLMKKEFDFAPGFAGMPFPPFMMNGPHFHPPMNMTINALPNTNPRTEMDPVGIEIDQLTKVKTDLLELDHHVNDDMGLKSALANLNKITSKAASESYTATEKLFNA